MPQDHPLAVFIADDSAPVAEMLRELITERGKVEIVGVAETEESIMDGLRRTRPDVLVLDLQLKTGSGADVIRAARALPELSRLHIIVMSNHTSPQLQAGCLELGANAYFDKVKDLPRLTTELARIAAERKKPG